MADLVNLEMSYSTYLELCDAIEEAATRAEGFNDIQHWVHLVDFLEEAYERNCAKQNLEYKTWKLHEELFQNKNLRHHQYFYSMEEIFNEYDDKQLLEWKISEQDKFHLICELIDVFKDVLTDD